MPGVVKILVGSVLGLAGATLGLYLGQSLWQPAGPDPDDSTSDSGDEIADVSDDRIGSTEPTVVIDVFSGRPNPVFDLSDTELQTLEGLLASVVEAGPGNYGEPPQALEFRSFLLSSGWLAGDGIVTAEVIWAADGSAYADPDHLVYEFLRMSAAAKLEGVEDLVPASR